MERREYIFLKNYGSKTTFELIFPYSNSLGSIIILSMFKIIFEINTEILNFKYIIPH